MPEPLAARGSGIKHPQLIETMTSICSDRMGVFIRSLPLYTAGAVSAYQALDLVSGGQVEVQLNGLLETGCGGGIFNSLLGAVVVHNSVEQTSGEGISAPHPVY